MTYKEKAIELLKEKMEIAGCGSDSLLTSTLNGIWYVYKPNLFGVLNAPEDLEDWDMQIPEKRIQTSYGKEEIQTVENKEPEIERE